MFQCPWVSVSGGVTGPKEGVSGAPWWSGSFDSRAHEVSEVSAPHGARADALVVFEQAADRFVQRAVHAALSVDRVGFALGS